MAGNLVGAVTARCRTELGDLSLATDMADVRICRIEGVAYARIYALSSIIFHD
jgi:hypothetical protein